MWRKLSSFPNYQISSDGSQVRNSKTGRVLKRNKHNQVKVTDSKRNAKFMSLSTLLKQSVRIRAKEVI